MRLATRTFETTTVSQSISAPAGARVVSVRIDQMGRGLAVLACPDDIDAPCAPINLLMMFEDADGSFGDGLAGWEHVASWLLNGHRQSHCFAKYAKAAKKPSPARLTKSGE